ncbi:MAG: STAS/SEC14 domain-containing protein [Myxococcales bacterium]|nr:STAS/SEC14 domain-containing protein [Myxococcales bacterium]
MKSEPFSVVVHAERRILEVRYPTRPTMEAFGAYEAEVRRAIEGLAKGGEWDCLVDQTALKALPPEFPPLIAKLNTWARGKGMRRTARVLSDSAIGELQTVRILKDAGVKDIGSAFKDRDSGWAWLTGK